MCVCLNMFFNNAMNSERIYCVCDVCGGVSQHGSETRERKEKKVWGKNARNKYDKLMKICHIFGTLDCNVVFLFRIVCDSFLLLFFLFRLSLQTNISFTLLILRHYFFYSSFDLFRWFDVTFIAI